MLTLYHRTSKESAETIQRHGFQDATGHYGTTTDRTGVWVSDQPLDGNEGAFGQVLLRLTVNMTEEELAPFEWIEELKGYREWLVPAHVINAAATVEIEDIDETPSWVLDDGA